MGSQSVEGGRAGESPSTDLAQKLDSYVFAFSIENRYTAPARRKNHRFFSLIEQVGESPSDRQFQFGEKKEPKTQ